MKSSFPLFQSHLDIAHSYWKRLVMPSDIVVDATCGNGQDTLILAELCPLGQVYAIDIQPKAIELTKDFLKNNLEDKNRQNIHLLNQCHSQFPQEIQENSVKLIVYNLGYLPGQGNKELTTQVDTTLLSLENALKLIQPAGALSVTLYPGHPEGEREMIRISDLIKDLSPKEWNCCVHQWPNRKKSPQLVFLQKHIIPLN